jgi:hypothetical protein
MRNFPEKDETVNFQYLLLRLLRHFMPESLARFLLKRRWIIRPGLESNDPLAAVQQYMQVLGAHGRSVAGKRILLFGYGGRFAVGAELLKHGASHVVLCDHYVLLDHERNSELLPYYSAYLMEANQTVKPDPHFITLLHGDIRDSVIQLQVEPVDLVLSTSVYEHLSDVNGITRALSRLTVAEGAQLHFVDLRDHYFKYPFEMLRFSEWIWKTFLNPTSNLNRLRVPDYQNIFQKYFGRVEVHVLAREEDEFRRAKPHIRPEFLTHDLLVDSVTLIHIFSEIPLPQPQES